MKNKLPLRRGRAREPKPRPPPHVDGGDEREPIPGDEVEEEMNETKEEEKNEVNEEEENEGRGVRIEEQACEVISSHFEDVAGNDGGDDVELML
ncbi:hypothetical protein Bca52824_015716 [Brassica carinata]|uniref:Uncharacterized protein n=1 Tax=Brassica carinata TaxID=52824 RepID=A0A8X7W289_BRACI|nr:hypothetical protein Bca52824_015716 [Brassica carinata]